MIGKQILNYKIISLLGEGGMGDVYLAEHLTIKRKVAIKVLKPVLVKNDEIKRRFKNEASVMAQLQHSNIVGLLDYLEDEDGLYLIMEFVEGKTLDIFLSELSEPLSIQRSKEIMIQMLKAFAYAHKNGIVHRDVKPSNIIINANDEIKVLDFGIAKIIGDSQHNLTKTGSHIGTVYYMSPEQVKASELDSRSDIYSLGITFYELLAGFCPYKGATSEYEIFNKIVNDPLVSLEDSLGKQYNLVWNAIQKATQKKPEDRFQTCEEFIETLKGEKKAFVEKKVEQSILQAKKETPVYEPEKSKKGIFILISALAVLGLAIFWLFKGGDKIEEEKGLLTSTTKAYTLVGSINLRDTTSTNAVSLGEVVFGDTVQLLGSPTEAIQDKEFKIVWQKARWKDLEGWVAISIDEQPTVGPISDFSEMEKILNFEYNIYAEYGKVRSWTFSAIRDFLREKSWINNYSFMAIDKDDLKSEYRTIIKYHRDEYYKKKDPFDYVIMMQSKNGSKIALFLRAKLDNMGGTVVGYVHLPSETKLLGFEKYYKADKKYYGKDFDIGNIYLVDANYNYFASLDDEGFGVNYIEVYPVQEYGDGYKEGYEGDAEEAEELYP